jgi:CDP-diacylglycerol--glycerol-3-phosphate 3-phosphatidyltransferase
VLDIVCSWLLVSALALLALVYAVRVAARGFASYERVNKDQGSALLGTRAMEMGYWALEPAGRALARAKVSANVVSWASLLLGVSAGVALAMGHLGAGALLAALSALGDTLDGMVARRTKTASDAGEVLDAAVDRYVEFFFLGGLAVYYRADVPRLVLALSALLGSFMVSYATAKAEAFRTAVPRGAMRRPERAAYLTAGAALTPLTSAWAVSSLQPAWVAQLPMLIALGLVALVANASAIARMGTLAATLRARPPPHPSLAHEGKSSGSAAGIRVEAAPKAPGPGLGRMVN